LCAHIIIIDDCIEAMVFLTICFQNVGSHIHSFLSSIFAAYCLIRVSTAPIQILSNCIALFVFWILEAAQCIRLDVQSDSDYLSPKLQTSTFKKILKFRRRRQLPRPSLYISYGLYTQTRYSFLIYLDNLVDTLVTVLLWDNPL